MESAQPFVVLLAWYAPGFLAARVMSRRGHDPLPWIYAAWIAGALTAVAAVAWVRFTSTRSPEVRHTEPRPTLVSAPSPSTRPRTP